MHHKEEIEALLDDGKHDNMCTDCRGKEGEKVITNADQQIIRSSESHGEKLPTPSIKGDEAVAVQGIYAKQKHKI